MTDLPDWETIIQKHLDGQTTEAEAAELSEQIVSDATVRSDYLKAARIHGALSDETMAFDLEAVPFPQPEARKERSRPPFAMPRQLAAAMVTGAFVGLLGVGVVWAVNSPRSEASFIPVANGDFQSMSEPVATGFPHRFGYWSGNPAEIVEETNGNQTLRFLETGNVMGDPGGGASNCSVFQLVNLTSLQLRRGTDRSDSQMTLELSAQFRRETAPNDADLPMLDASIRLYLFQGEPEFVSSNWPDVLRDADALGKQSIKLSPGDKSATISTSCILSSEVTMALIAVSANTRMGSTTPVKLGGYYVDDVQLTAIKQPVLPVRFVK